MSAKYLTQEILIIDSSKHELANVVEKIKIQTSKQVDYYSTDSWDTTISLLMSEKWSVILYSTTQNQNINALLDKMTLIHLPIPIILLQDDPSVDQVVDLMQAGIHAIADYRNIERVIYLIRKVLDAEPIITQESIYKNIVDYQTELICRYDADFRLLFVNRAYSEWQGRPSNELIGTQFITQIPQEDRDRAYTHVKALTVESPVAVSVHASVISESDPRIIEWTDRAIFDDNGQLIEYQGVGRDVTAREQQAKHLLAINRELEDYRTHLDAILASMQDALLSLSLPERQVIFVSNAFEKVFGYPYDRFINDVSFFHNVVHPDDLERALQAMQTCIIQGFVELDHRIVWPDGQIRWVHRRAWINFDSNGQPIRINDNAQDITDRKQAENDLQAREEQLKSLIDSQTNYLIRNDLNGYYTYWNPKFEREFGWVHESNGMLGSISLGSICSYHHQRTKETVERCLANPGVPYQVELDKPSRDGRIRTTLWEFICLTNSDGVPIAFQCVGIDISTQKQALSIIEYQASLLQQVSDAVIATDNDLKITSWNKAATEIYGWTEEEAIGQQIDELLKTDWFAESPVAAQAKLAREGQWQGEVRKTDKTGGRHYILVSVNLLYNEQHEPIGSVRINRDITYDKRHDTLQKQISQILEATVERQELSLILKKLTLAIEEFETDLKASVLILDPHNKQLRHGAAPSLPAAYNEAIDGISIGSNVGSCGTAAFEKRLVVVADIATDPLWKDYKDIAAQHGLKACWSQPIIGHNNLVLGTFALYYAQIRQPSSTELDLIQLAARIAGLVIENAQTEAALRESEEQFRQFMRHLPGAVFIKNSTEQTLYCNERYAALRGRFPEDIIGKYSHEYISPDIATPFIQENELVLQQGQAMEFNHTFPSPDGLSHWLTIKFPIPRQNKSSLLGAVSLDITREKQAEESLRRSEQRYRQMFEQVSLPKLITDPQTAHILDANKAAVDFYGHSLETLKTMTMMQINIAEPADILKKMTQVLNGEISSCLFKQRLADGTVREVEGFAAGIELNGQQVLYCTYVDVTERNFAQAALQKANQELEQRVHERTKDLEQAKDRIEAIFNHSGDGILLLNTELRIEQSNYTFDKMFSITPDSYVSKTLLDIIAEKNRTALLARLYDVIEYHGTQRMDIQALRLDGSVFDAEISIAPVNRTENAVKNIVCIIRDTSDRKRAEIERQRYIAEIEDLYNNAPAGYHSLDPTGIFVQINDTELEWLGYTREEVIGKQRFVELLSPESKSTFRQKFPLLQQKGEINDIEFEMVRKDGTTIWVLGSASVVWGEQGEFIRSRATLYNITELKLAQKAIAEERNLLRTVIDAVPDFIYVKNRQNHIILNNVAHASFLKHLVTKPTKNRTDLEILLPEAAVQVQSDLDEAHIFATGEAIYHIEDHLIRDDGDSLWILTTKVPLYNLDHEVIGLVVISHDITTLKANEEALRISEKRLRESENMLQIVMDTIPVRVFWKDINSVYLGCNCLFAQDVGLVQTSEIVGKRDADLTVFLEQSATYRADDSFIIESGIPRLGYEESFTDRDGNRLTVLTNKQPLRDTENTIIGILGTYIDITERKAAEIAIRTSEEKFRMFIESAPIATIINDLDGKIVLLNNAAERLFGYAHNELIGESIQVIVPDELRDNHRLQISEFIFAEHQKRSEAQELLARHKYGNSFPAEIQLSLVNLQPTPLVMAFIMDITQRKQAEETLRLALEREKELGELKSRFVSIASHQFRTPLAVILANTETLSNYRDRMDNTQINLRLDRITKQVSYMKNMIEDVLELARIQNDQVLYQPIEGNLDLLCQEIIEDFEHQEDYRNRLIYHSPSKTLNLQFDPHLMHHVISNLIHNALKYSTNEQLVHVHLLYSEQEIVLTIKDQGIGIPAEDIKHLFEPFYRATNVGAFVGTGLGLSIAKQAVKAHGGSIDVESKPNVGTTFTITLPNIR